MKKIKIFSLMILTIFFVFINSNYIKAFNLNIGTDPNKRDKQLVEINRHESFKGKILDTKTQVNNVVHNINVNKDYKINEKVEFKTDGKTKEIEIAIPQKYTINQKVGNTTINKSLYYPVKNFKSNVKILKEDEFDGYKVYLLDINDKKEVSYTYDIEMNNDLGYKDKQLFYYDLTNIGKNTLEKNVKYVFHFPQEIKNIKTEDFKFNYQDEYTKEYKDNVLTIKIPEAKHSLRNSLSVELPIDYFNLKNINIQDYIAFILVGISTLFSIVLFVLYGKNYVIETKTVKKPFNDFSPADMLSLLNIYEMAEDSHKLSVILEWYTAGLIDIQPDSDIDCYIVKTKELTKENKMKPLYKGEIEFWDSLFKESDTINIGEPNFTKNIELIESYENLDTRTDKTKKYKEKSKKTLLLQYLSTGLLMFSTIAFTMLTVKEDYSILTLIAFYSILSVFYFIGIAKTEVKNSIVIITLSLFLPFITVLGNYLLFYTNTTNWIILGLWLLLLIISTLFIGYLGNYNKENLEDIGKVEGFRDFIEDANLIYLENMSSKDKHYFEEILPYAYVFGCVSSWIERYRQLSIQTNIDLGYDQLAFFSFLSVIESLNKLGNNIKEDKLKLELESFE